MDLADAVERIGGIRSRLDRRLDAADELVGLAVRRLVSEPFEVLSKGLNPSRFDSWSTGARSKVARQFGSSSDLMLEVLSRSINPDRGDLSSMLASAGDVIAAGDGAAGVSIPDDVNVVAEYPIALVADAPNPAGAQAFIDFVVGSSGQKILAAYGFGSP